MRSKAYLDTLVTRFEQPAFIADDPVSICHAFTDPRDQQVIGLYAALLAWGRRSLILTKLEELCGRMSHRPWAFVRGFRVDRDRHQLDTFGHRTFLPLDALIFTRNLNLLLRRHGSIERIFDVQHQNADIGDAIERFSRRMMEAHDDTPPRLQKHLARPSRNSACKRLCLYFRWMVRGGPVDLGLWKSVRPSQLILPLDVHSGRQARALGLLKRAANDWKAALMLTQTCRTFNAEDPARYDFAFFGLGAYGSDENPLNPNG